MGRRRGRAWKKSLPSSPGSCSSDAAATGGAIQFRLDRLGALRDRIAKRLGLGRVAHLDCDMAAVEPKPAREERHRENH